MTGFATAVSNRDAHWCVIITIEGVGEYAGQWKFCSTVPDYAAADSTYKPWLREWPDVLSERVEILGGAPDAGELSIVVLDGHDGDRDALTSLLRTKARSVGYLPLARTSSEVTITVSTDTPYTAGSSVIFIGSEALLVTAKPGGNALTVTRAALGTEARAHDANDRVYLYTPSVRSRRMRLYLTPKDGGSSADETQFGPDYYLDDFALSEDLNAYVIRGKGQRKYLDRLVPPAPISMVVESLPSPQSNAFGFDVRDPHPTRSPGAWPNEDFFVQFGDEDDDMEIVAMSQTWALTNALSARPTRRGICGTRLNSEIKTGDTAWQVFVADRDVPGSVRYSPGPSPSTSTTSGTWRASDHWIDIILWLATSSAHPDDGLRLTNYLSSGTDAERSNWSSAPTGIGAGIPISLIDVTGLLALRDRTASYRFPGYSIGAPWKDGGESFLEHITRWFLRPIGAFATVIGGQFSIVLPRVPLEGETAVAVGNDQIVREEGDGPLYSAGIGARQDMTLLASRVSYKTRGPRGTQEIINVTDSDFAGLYGQAGYYATEEQTIEIDAPGIVSTTSGERALLIELAMRRLWRFHKPLWSITFTTDFSLYATAPGDLVAMSNVELPNESTGARTWTSVGMQVVERAIKIGDGRGITIAWKAVGFGPGPRFGRIAPSAYITGVSGNAATINESRYTQSDAAPSGLPVTDAAAFTVGDNLALKNLDGSSVTTKRETISSRSGNVLTMSGNFTANLAVGLVLVYAPSADALTTQLASYVFFADESTGTVGALTDTAWSYAEA